MTCHRTTYHYCNMIKLMFTFKRLLFSHFVHFVLSHFIQIDQLLLRQNRYKLNLVVSIQNIPIASV